MKSNRVKKIILAVLTLVVVYIWYGNLKIYTGTDTVSIVSAEQESSKNVSGSKPENVLTYIEPKLNPFEAPEKSDASPGQNKRRIVNKIPDPPPKAPSQSYKMVGSLNSGKTRIATLKETSGRQLLISPGDSLAGWKTVRIRQDRIIFGHKKLRDTLRLATIELQ
ncbi:MAG: hypothetical protein IIB00_08295 [candidate division Zixibacteria bacterium]|nr:hypothetical protein [candidate division Zixibacteria bacterium]